MLVPENPDNKRNMVIGPINTETKIFEMPLDTVDPFLPLFRYLFSIFE
jgi:hypothetical protein